MSALDLTLLSMYRIGGQEWPLLPGLQVFMPPRKPARGREQDRLIIYLTLAGNSLFSTAEYSQITEKMSAKYYSTSGSLTYALKTISEWLNDLLVERNMKSSGQGRYAVGVLVLAAMRGNLLYIVQSGPTHAFWMTGREVRHYFDPQMAGKGLGLSQSTHLYFAQASLNPGDRLLFTAGLPSNWEKSLTEEQGLPSLDATRRRLMNVSDANISAVMIQAADGSGALNLVRPSKDLPAVPAPQPAQPVTPPPVSKPAQAASLPVSTPPAAAPRIDKPNPSSAPSTPPVQNVTPVSRPAPSPVSQVSRPEPSSARRAAVPGTGQPVASRPVALTPPAPARPSNRPPASISTTPKPQASMARKPQPELPNTKVPKEVETILAPDGGEQFTRSLQQLARFLAQALHSIRTSSTRIMSSLQEFMPRLLPGQEDELPRASSLPPFIAVVFPILVVVVSTVIYTQIGRPAEYSTYYAHAIETANKALTEKDPTILRKYWEDTLAWLDTADQYQVTSNSQELRQQAQSTLDDLNRTVRVDYKLALNTPLSNTINITQLAASDTDLYLLESTQGTVMRANLNGNSFTLDPSFKCGPGTYNNVTVGPLINMIALSRTNPSGSTLIGIDSGGNLIYCATGTDPHATTLQPPDTGWNHITSIAYDANNLYILDAPANAVWVYFGTVDVKFVDKPLFFFEAQVPKMSDAIGLAVNGEDLYLLHQDGHLTTCTLSLIQSSPTRCTDPATFVDTRPGYTNGTTIPDGLFTQIAFTSPPDPSVALLESNTQAVFRFSSRALQLQNQIKPLPGTKSPFSAGQPITAMAFSPNKVLFALVNGQVYFAINLP